MTMAIMAIMALLELSGLNSLNGLIEFDVTMFMVFRDMPNVLTFIIIILACTTDFLSKSMWLKAHYSKTGYPSFLAF